MMSSFGEGLGRLCGVLAAPTAAEIRVLLTRALRDTPTIEVRLDWLRSDKEREKFLKWFRRFAPKRGVYIATCRRRAGGGEFSGTSGAELHWLIEAKRAGFQWCDVEVETLRELPGKSIRGYDVPGKVLLSMHDFRRTPALPKHIRLPTNAGADALKVAAMARSFGDAAKLLRFARGTKRTVVVPMGAIGLPARILALREGSALAYAPVAASTAPGQVSLQELRHLYRAHQLTGKTRVFGVIGAPIEHSLSPLLHNTGYVAAKKDAVFLPFLVEKLGDFVRNIPEFGVSGFSVTIPHKQAIFRYLKECEPLATEIGAVNTVTVRRDGSLYGSNTDYLGVLRALEGKIKLPGSRALVYGAGGAARAAAFALKSAGAQVFICARRDAAARRLARAVGGEVVRRPVLKGMKFDVILNSTPIGMHPQEFASPLRSGELNCSVVMDLIYRPLQTKLLQMAKAKGMRTVSGAEMFLAQGIAQWEGWMGAPAPEKAMRSAVIRALQPEKNKRW
jgi:3-dehydroquinate dehydratase / shikimate dehydrogenase